MHADSAMDTGGIARPKPRPSVVECSPLAILANSYCSQIFSQISATDACREAVEKQRVSALWAAPINASTPLGVYQQNIKQLLQGPRSKKSIGGRGEGGKIRSVQAVFGHRNSEGSAGGDDGRRFAGWCGNTISGGDVRGVAHAVRGVQETWCGVPVRPARGAVTPGKGRPARPSPRPISFPANARRSAFSPPSCKTGSKTARTCRNQLLNERQRRRWAHCWLGRSSPRQRTTVFRMAGDDHRRTARPRTHA